MKEPLRLSDPRSQASAEMRALLGAGAPPAPLPAATRERVRRALASRTVTTERTAVCWSHALGCALAVATAAMWLAMHRAEHVQRPIARAPEAAPAASPAHEQAPARPARAVHVEPRAESQVVAVVDARPIEAAPRAARARRAAPGRRITTGAARSHKRIEALVDDILKPEAQLLDRARREVERDPEQTLALIDTFRRRNPGSPIPAPTAVAEVDALRRLGRFEEAVARARALLESSRKPYYADEMAERFALLDL